MTFRAPALLATFGAVLALTGCGTSTGSMQTVDTAAKLTLSRNALATVSLDHATAFGGVRPLVLGRAASLFPSGLAFEALDLATGRPNVSNRWYLTYQPERIYVSRRPPLGSPLPAGKTWLAVTADGSRPLGAREKAFVAQAEGLNPQFMLNEIVWGGISASQPRTVVIAHVPYTRYTVSVDLTKALAKATGTARVAIQQQLAASPGSKVVPIAVMIDGPGHLSWMRGMQPGSGLGTVTVTLSDFGVKVKPSLPPPAIVAELGSLSLPRSPWALG